MKIKYMKFILLISKFALQCLLMNSYYESHAFRYFRTIIQKDNISSNFAILYHTTCQFSVYIVNQCNLLF